MATQSIFTTGYTAEPKLDDTGNARMAFLAVSNDSADSLTALGFSSETANDIATNGFWHMVIQSITETHIDAFSLANTLSDTISIFSTGALPVGITITGMILTTPEKDDRLNFLKLYADKIRGTQVAMAKSILCFGFKDTLMRLYLQNITFSSVVNQEDFTQISLNGIASHYTTVTFTHTTDNAATTTSSTPTAASVSKMVIPTGISLASATIPPLRF